jgi:2-phospho-L-lactate guanylyltransferase
MTLAVLIPVKDLSQAKTRLAHLLSAEERLALAGIMLAGVLEAVSRLPAAADGEGLQRVVVTVHAASAELGRRLGFEILSEPRPQSESDSVDRASAHLEAEGARGVLRIPLDLPLIAAEDLERLMATIREGCAAVLVPSLSGTGTNALYRSPPTLFPSRFGPGSLALHERAARRRAQDVRLLPLASLALDVDDPDDVRELVRRAQPCAALDYLRARGIEERLARLDAPGKAAESRPATRFRSGS